MDSNSRNWANIELATAEFGDQRLNKRFIEIAKKWSESPESSIPKTFDVWSSTKAVYRFFENKRVSPEKILFPHFEMTYSRMKAKKTVLVIQDTCFLMCGRHKRTQGLGKIMTAKKIYNQEFENLGLVMHTALAVDSTGLPLGLVDQRVYSRSSTQMSMTGLSTDLRAKIPIELKESVKWIDPMERVALTYSPPDESKIVHVGDREADFFELFWRARELNSSILVRCTHDRVLGVRSRKRNFQNEKLFERARAASPLVCYEVSVNPTQDRDARQATVVISSGTFQLTPERRHSLATSNLKTELNLNFVYVKEIDAPNGTEPLEWLLISNLESPDFSSALEKVRWYGHRWQIETFHKILKSGFKIESCQLNHAEKRSKYIHLMSILAWRVHWLTWISRVEPQTPATDIFSF
jgi:hypothetical protein